MRQTAAVLLSVAACAQAAPSADLVPTIPGFPGDAPFKTYAGYLDVPGPIAGYSSLRIAYIFNEAIGADPQSKPLVAWHQGGHLGRRTSRAVLCPLARQGAGRQRECASDHSY